MPDQYPLPSADPASLGFAETPLRHLDASPREGSSNDVEALPHPAFSALPRDTVRRVPRRRTDRSARGFS